MSRVGDVGKLGKGGKKRIKRKSMRSPHKGKTIQAHFPRHTHVRCTLDAQKLDLQSGGIKILLLFQQMRVGVGNISHGVNHGQW